MLNLPDDGDGGPSWLSYQLLSLPPPHDGDGVVPVSSALQVDVLALVGGHHTVPLHHEARRS